MAKPAKHLNHSQQNFLSPLLKDQLNPKHPLYVLAGKLDWARLESELLPYYSDKGRPAKPIRLMAGLMLLKQLDNLGDETVMAKWLENPYYQFFCGMDVFQWHVPVDPSDFVYFRKRLGEEGMERILKLTVDVHGEEVIEDQIVADTTVQQKAIRFPTDARLYHRSLEYLWRIARKEGIRLKQSYKQVAKKLIWAQFKGDHPRRKKQAKTALKALKVRTGRVFRDLQRQLGPEALKRHAEVLDRIGAVLVQQKSDKNKIYSIHAPEVACIAKGKAFPKYEFGSKVSLIVGRERGVVLAAKAFEGNPYDGNTLEPSLEQFQRLHAKSPTDAIADRGYRGRKTIGTTQVHIPAPPPKNATRAEKQAKKVMFRRRTAIEPRIGHLKNHHGLNRNWLKGSLGDAINLLLAASAYNLRLWMIRFQEELTSPSLASVFAWLRRILQHITRLTAHSQAHQPQTQSQLSLA
jgi:IS5 family transposase